jgi:hypothetical protein
VKLFALPLILFGAVAFAQAPQAQAPDASNVTGKWKVHVSVAGNDSDSECTFIQKDSELTGSCVGDAGPKQLTGKVDGKKVSWTYVSEYNGSPLTLKYSGTYSPGKIAGDIDVEEFSVSGDFTATLEP